MDEYEYDVEYTSSDSEYVTSDYLSAEQVAILDKPQIMTMKSEQAVESLVKKYEPSGDVEYTMTKDIDADHYMTMKTGERTSDFQTTTATPVAPSVQNLSANQGNWKKPVMIGAACLAALWFFNQD